MIDLTPRIRVPDDAVWWVFTRAAGPGGQHGDKAATAVQLFFNTHVLPGAVRQRLAHLAGRRLRQDGVLVLTADAHRSQARNREDALARLCDLVQRAERKPRPRKPTRPKPAARRRRLEGKRHRGAIKARRGRVSRDDPP